MKSIAVAIFAATMITGLPAVTTAQDAPKVKPFDQIQDTAPRAPFDQIQDTAPRSVKPTDVKKN